MRTAIRRRTSTRSSSTRRSEDHGAARSTAGRGHERPERRRDAGAPPRPRSRSRRRRRSCRWAATGTSRASSGGTATSGLPGSTTSARSGISCARSDAPTVTNSSAQGSSPARATSRTSSRGRWGRKAWSACSPSKGELRAFRTYQKQPAHRARPLEEQLHGFMWNRKQRYAVLLVEALDLERVPRPLDRVLEQSRAQRKR